MRVSVNTNEYRTILFAVDNDNIIINSKKNSSVFIGIYYSFCC